MYSVTFKSNNILFYIIVIILFFLVSDLSNETIQKFTILASTRRKCLNLPVSFCYICGSFTVLSQRMSISEFVKRAYLTYFKVKMDDQDKSWALHNTCKPCVKNLCQSRKETRKQLSFGIRMVWREQKNHLDDSYFCLTETSGYSKKTPQKLRYPNLDSPIRPVPHSHEIPVPVFTVRTCFQGTCLFSRYVLVFTVLPSLADEDDVCESDENHGHISDRDFVNISTKELEPYSGWGGKKPPLLYQFFPCNFYKRRN